jgi:aryl-alcohol dehydrogenase-like predicted oxidoreductase
VSSVLTDCGPSSAVYDVIGSAFAAGDTKGDRSIVEYTELDILDRAVSRIGLGTWSIGGWMWGGSDEKEALSTIRKALDLGVNLIDTAPVYGFGRSEKIVGKAIAQFGRREDVILSTKAGIEWRDSGDVFRNSGRDRIFHEVDASLSRIGTGYIDIYFVHWPDPLVPFEETADALNSLLEEGKIRAIGVSNYATGQMERFRSRAPIHVAQPPYNLFERDIEKDILSYCRANDIAVMAYGSLCRGLLSGGMSDERTFEGDDLRRIDPKFRQPRFDRYLAAVDELDAFAGEKYGKRVLHLAIRWLLDRNVEFALWGARLPRQLDPLTEVDGWHLNEEDLREIDRIVENTVTDPVGPGFMAPPARGRTDQT